MPPRRKTLLPHRQVGQQRTGPSNVPRATVSTEDDVGEILMQEPATIHEQISLVTLRQTAGNKHERRMASGTIRVQNNARSSSATSRHSKSSRSVDDSRHHKQKLQRANFSDEALPTTSRPATGSHPRNIKLPTLSTHSSRKQATKPCRKNSHSTTQNTTTKDQTTRSRPKTCTDTKHGAQGQTVSQRPPSKPKAIPILAAITPDNVEQEKVRFFSSDFDYNPQFTYRNPPSTRALERYGRASNKLMKLAIQVFRATLQRFQTYKRFEATTGGRPISSSQFTAMFQQYLAQEGLANKVVLNLSDSLVARALMTRMNGRPTLNARPNALKAQWSDGLLRHEIGTHYIRSANNREHPWSSPKGRRHYRLGPVNPTEEGMASIHSVLLRKEPFLWRSAMLYYTTYMASRLSFADLFRDLGMYIEDSEVRWDYCLRAKRGQTDTSKPGCFNKDQVYLEGAFRVLRYRHTIDFHSLYKLGKVALDDVDRLKTLVDLDSPGLKIPTFMTDIDEYRKRLDYIVLKNGLDDAQLAVLFPGETACGKTVAVSMPVGHEVCLEAQGEGGHCSTSDELVE